PPPASKTSRQGNVLRTRVDGGAVAWATKDLCGVPYSHQMVRGPAGVFNPLILQKVEKKGSPLTPGAAPQRAGAGSRRAMSHRGKVSGAGDLRRCGRTRHADRRGRRPAPLGAERAAKKRLRRYFRQLCFRRVGGSRFFALSLAQVTPTLADLIRPGHG